MTFVFTEKRPRPEDDRFSWEPFVESDEFSEDWWWYRRFDPDDPYILFGVRLGEVEVARLELEPGVVIHEAYAAPELDTTAVEISLFEVAGSQRRQGVGSRVVQAMGALYAGRRLLAFSEDADQFWASLGWQRYDHPDGPAHRSLFVQPAG